MRYAHKSIAILDRSSVGEARRAAVLAAEAIGFDEGRRSNVGIVATEAANNILLHAQTGEFLICPFVDRESAWIDLLALDSGPGIHDVSRAMEDGFSSLGTAGQGLGAIDRLSDHSSLYTIPGKGTAVWSRFLQGPLLPAMASGVVNVPVRGEVKCGDGYFASFGSRRSIYMLVDGLGHGAGAAEAADEAVAIIASHSLDTPSNLVLRAHDALKKTRGAAMSVAIADFDRMVLVYAGVGNISATLINGPRSRSLVSQNGTLGAVLPRAVQEYSYPIEEDTALLMFSDGLSSKSSPVGYSGLQNRHPALISGILYRDFSRKRDDATALFAPLRGARI